MYKVFVNDKPLFLTNEVEKETDFKLFLLESVDPDEKEILDKVKEKIPVKKAGGGLVYNKKGEVLFIFRNGKWDLPKGGCDKEEEIEDCSIREVEEETGVTNLKISKKLQKTYHVFKRNGVYRLKVTHWFEMTTTFEGTPIPQENEGIEKVAWLNKAQIKEALTNSYENIKLLFEN
jgi:8-oxo-dGTP pyrophosphatase MutT (NUDIX family)